MVATIQAREITFPELETIFYLDELDDDQFFREWQDDLPEVTDAEKQILDKVKEGYFNLLRHPHMPSLIRSIFARKMATICIG